MPFPTGIGVIDTLIGLPTNTANTRHEELHQSIDYLFTDQPDAHRTDSSIDDLLREMDAHGIDKGLVPVHHDDPLELEAVRRHPDRLLGCWDVEPNAGMEGVRQLQRAHEEVGIVGAQFMPAILSPPTAINDKRCYPIYAKCVELGIPVFVNGGVPGPPVPYEVQHPGLVDEVCRYFPELTFVFRHCCEPWVDLTVKLLLKYPNLYYSTTGFAPKYYPKAILDFANTRGADKILYGGYYPYGLTLDRIFGELAHLGLKDEVWPQFLRNNALRVLGLPDK